MPKMRPIAITAEEYDKLPHGLRRRVEVIDGYVRVSPSPSYMHQRVSTQLVISLSRQLPGGLECITTVDVRLQDDPLCVRIPDILLVKTERSDDRVLKPLDVLLAVEIASPSTERVDRLHKHVEYANAGIPHYWLVELERDEDAALRVFRLRGGKYQRAGVHHTGVARLREPFPIEIDIAGLMRVG